MQLETHQWPMGAWDKMEREDSDREKREGWGRVGRDLSVVCHPAGF